MKSKALVMIFLTVVGLLVREVLERRMNYTRFLFMRYNGAGFCFLFLLYKEKHDVRRPEIWRVT